MTDLFECLFLNMWEIPYQQALMEAKQEELNLLRKLEHGEIDRISKTSNRQSSSQSKSADNVTEGDREAIFIDKASVHTSAESSVMENVTDRVTSVEIEDSDFEGELPTADTMMEVSFDAEKCVNCVVENKRTLVHSTTGKGYGVATTAISSGCYQWKVRKPFIDC